MEELKVSMVESGDVPKYEANTVAEMSMSIYVKEEPIAIRIVRSGWGKPAMYHVLVEFGDYGDTNYNGLMDATQIKERYGVEVLDHDSITSFIVKYPNNMDLGKEIRSLANQYKQKTQI
jgi:hypothetical protein